MVERSAPLLSVTVPTRGRPEHLRACVESVLACSGPPFELLVVDQSNDRATEEALRSLLADPRLRYLRSDTRGVCAARNLGIAQSRADLLVCTDDDCRADPDWLARLAAVFAGDDLAAVVCGRVDVPPEAWRSGWAAFYPATNGLTTWESLRRGPWGITANLALRRSAVERVGAFDAALGAGGPLQSGGEPDLLYRALRAGLRIVDAPEARVTHLGIRPVGPELRALFARYFFGLGAAYGKHARLGDLRAVGLLLACAGREGGNGLLNLLRHGRPVGWGSAAALLRGLWCSRRFPVDPVRRLYRVQA